MQGKTPKAGEADYEDVDDDDMYDLGGAGGKVKKVWSLAFQSEFVARPARNVVFAGSPYLAFTAFIIQDKDEFDVNTYGDGEDFDEDEDEAMYDLGGQGGQVKKRRGEEQDYDDIDEVCLISMPGYAAFPLQWGIAHFILGVRTEFDAHIHISISRENMTTSSRCQVTPTMRMLVRRSRANLQ